jgi:hypothetical protein
MKKYLITIFLFTLTVISAACDFCNCYIPINPLAKKNYIGFRYRLSNYTGAHLPDAQMKSLGLTNSDFSELKTEYELHGQFYAMKRFQILFSIPYVLSSHHSVSGSDGHEHSDIHITHADQEHAEHLSEINMGIGDPVVIIDYRIIDKNSIDTLSLKQTLFFGVGLKSPLGRYRISETESIYERRHLPGTGSFDSLANLTYLAKRKSAGININVNYLIAGDNDQFYRYGNRFNGKISVFYEFKWKEYYIFLSTGPYFETSDYDKYRNEKVFNSGGTVTYSQAAIDLYYKKLSFSMEVQLPLVQNMIGYQPVMNYRLISGIKYSFN